MINGYVSVKTILARLYMELGTLTEIPESHVIEFVADALSLIGSYAQYEENTTILELEDGKAQLPLNFYRLIDITHLNRPVMYSSNSFIKDYGCEDCKIPKICNGCNGHSFYISNSYIITDIKTQSPNNKLCISYLGVPVDDEGYPLVPDDIYFLKACTAYVIYRLDYKEWRKGNITDKVFKKSESEWLFYVGSAKGAANMPDAKGLENLKSIMVRLLPAQCSSYNSFRNLTNPERRRRFN